MTDRHFDPYGFVAEAGADAATGRPAGSTPYLGETGIEMQFVDSAKGTILAECRDTQIGRKYAAELDAGATGAAQTWASGYVNSSRRISPGWMGGSFSVIMIAPLVVVDDLDIRGAIGGPDEAQTPTGHCR